MKHITIHFASGRVVQVTRRWYDGVESTGLWKKCHLLDGRCVWISTAQVEQAIEEAQ